MAAPILKIGKDPITLTIKKAKVVSGNFGNQLWCAVQDHAGDEATLYLPWVFPIVDQHFQALGLGAGLFNRPVGRRAYIDSDGCTIQAGLENVGFPARRRYTQRECGGFGVPEKSLGLVGWAGEFIYPASGQANPVCMLLHGTPKNL